MHYFTFVWPCHLILDYILKGLFLYRNILFQASQWQWHDCIMLAVTLAHILADSIFHICRFLSVFLHNDELIIFLFQLALPNYSSEQNVLLWCRKGNCWIYFHGVIIKIYASVAPVIFNCKMESRVAKNSVL